MLLPQATVEISSRYDGIITKVNYQVGEMINVGAALVDIEIVDESLGPQATDSVAPSSTPTAAVAVKASAAAAATAGKPSREVRATRGLCSVSSLWRRQPLMVSPFLSRC
jgi:2-oxoisovalerate dehydrogenase E2 component (dihydrolipoyl transacylase)